MKKIISVCVLISTMIIFIASCNKNNSTTSKSGLTLSNATVKKGQPLVVTSNVSGGFVKWTVNPSSAGTWVNASGNKSVILFSNAGSYTITANYFTDSVAPVPYDSSSSGVVVTDSIYNDSSGQWAHCDALEQVPIANNDQIFLTPISYSDTGLVLLAHTLQTYGNYYPTLGFPQITDSADGTYIFGFGEVTESPCNNSTSTPTPAAGTLSLAGLTNGVHNFTLTLNNAIYQGTLTVTDTECTFIWNYTSGIIISPLTITKQ